MVCGYFRFCLSDRDVEGLMAECGVILTDEVVWYWCRTCGQAYAHQLRRRRPQPGDKWHLAEAFRTIHGERHYLWRAVDQDGHVPDILVQRRRDKKAEGVLSQAPQGFKIRSPSDRHRSAAKRWCRHVRDPSQC
jgi:transposase-like protein